MKQGIAQLESALADGGTEIRQFYPALATVADALIRDNTDPETAQWLDGRRFVRWLAKNGLRDMRGLSESMKANIRRWAQGQTVSLNAADELLTESGLGSVAELPDEVWAHPPTGRDTRSPSPQEKREIVALCVHADTPAAEVAERYGFSPGAVRRWAREAA